MDGREFLAELIGGPLTAVGQLLAYAYPPASSWGWRFRRWVRGGRYPAPHGIFTAPHGENIFLGLECVTTEDIVASYNRARGSATPARQPRAYGVPAAGSWLAPRYGPHRCRLCHGTGHRRTDGTPCVDPAHARVLEWGPPDEVGPGCGLILDAATHEPLANQEVVAIDPFAGTHDAVMFHHAVGRIPEVETVDQRVIFVPDNTCGPYEPGEVCLLPPPGLSAEEREAYVSAYREYAERPRGGESMASLSAQLRLIQALSKRPVDGTGGGYEVPAPLLPATTFAEAISRARGSDAPPGVPSRFAGELSPASYAAAHGSRPAVCPIHDSILPRPHRADATADARRWTPEPCPLARLADDGNPHADP